MDPEMTIAEFDLSSCTVAFTEWLSVSVGKFASQNPDIEISAMGLYFTYAGNKPYVILGFDTEESSDLKVKKYQHLGPDFYGEDEYGKFCKNPPDYQYQHLDFEFSDFPDLFELEVTHLTISTNDLTQTIDVEADGDTAINKVFFAYIASIVKNFDGHTALKRNPTFRLVLAAHNDPLFESWIA